MKEQLDLLKEFREKQEKYAYYLIALCVAAIGFAVTQTMDQPIKNIQIPLGLAVISWAFSIYCGLQFIGIVVASIYQNFLYLNLIQGRDTVAGNNSGKIEIGKNIFEKESEATSKKSIALYKWQERLFYLGIILFITWRILEMSSISNA